MNTLDTLIDTLDDVHRLIKELGEEMGVDSDEGNADNLERAEQALGDLQGAVMDIVP
jgi:hypothetical protein